MKHFWILVFCGWSATVDLYGDIFSVVLFREREDLYSFEVEEIGSLSLTKVTGQISSSNKHETSVKAIGEAEVNSADTVVTVKINGRAFIFASDRHVTLWSRGVNGEDRAGDVFNVCMGERTPFHKSKEPLFFLNQDVDGHVCFYEINDPQCKSIGISNFEILSPYGPNGHPWFSNEPSEWIKFDEAAPKPPKEKKNSMENNDYSKDDMGYFLRKK